MLEEKEKKKRNSKGKSVTAELFLANRMAWCPTSNTSKHIQV